tara:strand:- start:480 stop:626 length:147 start_codon:yes stop_codon:yes gene_type:complete
LKGLNRGGRFQLNKPAEEKEQPKKEEHQKEQKNMVAEKEKRDDKFNLF